ncbi:monocarboxylate transporter 12-like [Amphiura filiformis]|uniref:monocarboxylate transporter 12-like n=1 Tax=Amphiura filiformis TaxID=82378 RepID=UPI003B20F06E
MGEVKNWPIVCAAFVTQALTHGFAGSMGVFYVEWKKTFGEDLPGDGSSTIGWLTSFVLGVLLTTAPISGALSHHFGVRPVVMLGGCLSTLGLFISSFADTIHLLYFTIPITGFGCGLAYAASITIITKYFHKHFALASGITSTGISIGGIILPVIIQALVEYYTWRNAIMIIAGIIAQVCGALMKPPPKLEKCGEETKVGLNLAGESNQHCDQELCGKITIPTQDGDELETVIIRNGALTKEPRKSHFRVILDSLGITLIWTNRVYACALPMFFLNGGVYGTCIVYIKERAEVVGISDYNAALLISIIGVSGLVARAGHGRLVDKKIFHPTTLYAFANFLAAVSLPIIAVSEQYAVFVICAANIGFAAGLYIAINIVLVRGIVGVRRFPGGFGLVLLVIAISIMSSVAIAGLLLDYTGDYMAGFLYASIIQGLSGVWVLVSHVVWTKCVKDPRWPPSLPSLCHSGPNKAAELPNDIVRNKAL